MVFHIMKTTLNISDIAMQHLKTEAVRQQRTMSDLVESALRLLFQSSKTIPPLPPLPEFDIGNASVDVANRDTLYSIMES